MHILKTVALLFLVVASIFSNLSAQTTTTTISSVEGGFGSNYIKNCSYDPMGQGQSQDPNSFYKVFRMKFASTAGNTIDYRLDVMPLGDVEPLASITIPHQALWWENGKWVFELNNAQTFLPIVTYGSNYYLCRIRPANYTGPAVSFAATIASNPNNGGASMHIISENIDGFIAGFPTTVSMTKKIYIADIPTSISLFVSSEYSMAANPTSITANANTIENLAISNSSHLNPISLYSSVLGQDAVIAIQPSFANGVLSFNLTKSTFYNKARVAATWGFYVVIKGSQGVMNIFNINLFNNIIMTSGKTSLLNDETAPQLNCTPSVFAEQTQISFLQPEANTTSLQIYNSNGQLVHTLLNPTRLEAGEFEYSLDAANLPKGIYLVCLQIGRQRYTKKILKL